MGRGKFLPSLFLLVVAALFLFGMTKLLFLRFEKGDVYPPYSSYRSDPMGAKAFFEGLNLLPGVEAVRSVEPLPNIPGLSETTIFLFGLPAHRVFLMENASVKSLEEAALEGGRMVISFVPSKSHHASPAGKSGNKVPPKERTNKEKDEEVDETRPREEPYAKQYDDLSERWGVKVEPCAEEDKEAILTAPGKDLPPSLPWYGNLVFEPRDEDWSTVYTRAGKPVLIERSFGKGSIVLSSDSFFLSNEAMKSKRYPPLLSWLCGTHQKIIFDETHLGVTRSPGVATLLRKYGLAPFFFSLIILALLTIWKLSSRLVPADEEDDQATVHAGQDASAGLTNLLRRNISADHILIACLEEWKRSFIHGRRNLSALLPRIQEIIARDRSRAGKHRNPAQAYSQISVLLDRRYMSSSFSPRRKRI